MSLCTVAQVIDRVGIAPAWNGIAVFTDSLAKPRYNAVFSNTVKSQQDIKNLSTLIGVFDASHDIVEVRKILIEAYS